MLSPIQLMRAIIQKWIYHWIVAHIEWIDYIFKWLKISSIALCIRVYVNLAFHTTRNCHQATHTEVRVRLVFLKLHRAVNNCKTFLKSSNLPTPEILREAGMSTLLSLRTQSTNILYTPSRTLDDMVPATMTSEYWVLSFRVTTPGLEQLEIPPIRASRRVMWWNGCDGMVLWNVIMSKVFRFLDFSL